MKQVNELLEEYGILMGRTDNESEKRLQEIREELKAMDCPKMQEQLDVFLGNQIKAIEMDVNALKVIDDKK